jgi:hypothetical protein
MGISVKGGSSLGISQVKSEDIMATNLQMVTLLFYHSLSFFFGNDEGRG